MKRFRLFLLASAALFALSVALIYELADVPGAGARLAAFPGSGPDFASLDQPLSPAERAVYGEAEVIKRLYQVGRRRMVLLLVDVSPDRHCFPRPLAAFRRSGWRVASTREWSLPSGTARFVRLERGPTRAEVLFWYSDGVARHGSVPYSWFQAVLRRLTFGRSGPAPVLVLLHNAEGDTGSVTGAVDALPALKEF